MRTTLFKIAVIVAVFSLALSACGPKVIPETAVPGEPGATEAVAGEPKIITLAWTQEPNSLNRSYSSMWYQSALIQIYSCSPWQFNEANEPYAYMLTELPTITEDGLTATMHLRDDLKWSDGEPITSADFAFTYAMITSTQNSVDSVYPYDKFTISTPDDLTVVMNFSEVFTPWMASIWQGTLMPKHVLQPVFDADGSIDAAAWNMAPTVGCGPFNFTAWESGSYLRFDKNPNYWGTPAKLDAVIFQFVPDDAAQTAACLAGDADVCFWPPYEDIPAFRDAGLSIMTEPSGYNEGWFFNMRDMASPFIRDLNVRKAIAMALDRQANTDLRLNVVKYHRDLLGCLACLCGSGSIVAFEYDPEGAKALLEASGYIDTNGDGIREDARRQ